ncbi:MAG: ubiquinone/menaquinone biosynthesis methyltransferase [Betaproteobacteria bacterium]|nr:ubiquinone/menaquinone biosynthesis methyltransferase [Betaproteobacteria bacterium]
MAQTSRFGFALIPDSEKSEKINRLFDGVSGYYDLMNDVLSAGMHRIWKRQLVWLAAAAKSEKWLDLACGSGDIAALLGAGLDASVRPQITLADPSGAMLEKSRQRFCASGDLHYAQCPAENLPFADASFDGITCGFGMRNFTSIADAASEVRRVLKPGGRALFLEFTPPPPGRSLYRNYLLRGLPAIGARIAGDRASYRYLGESIIAHPPPEQIAAMLQQAGLEFVDWIALAGGIVAIHRARRACW